MSSEMHNVNVIHGRICFRGVDTFEDISQYLHLRSKTSDDRRTGRTIDACLDVVDICADEIDA
jgi:hypothetical protein